MIEQTRNETLMKPDLTIEAEEESQDIAPVYVDGAVITYNNNIHSTINMTPVDASNNPDKVKYSFISSNIKPKLKVGDYVRNADKRNIFSEGYTSN